MVSMASNARRDPAHVYPLSRYCSYFLTYILFQKDPRIAYD